MGEDNKYVHGTELIWTYGPLGWLSVPVATPEHLIPCTAVRLIVWLVMIQAAVRLIFIRGFSKATGVVVLMTVVAAVVPRKVRRFMVMVIVSLMVAIMILSARKRPTVRGAQYSVGDLIDPQWFFQQEQDKQGAKGDLLQWCAQLACA